MGLGPGARLAHFLQPPDRLRRDQFRSVPDRFHVARTDVVLRAAGRLGPHYLSPRAPCVRAAALDDPGLGTAQGARADRREIAAALAAHERVFIRLRL